MVAALRLLLSAAPVAAKFDDSAYLGWFADSLDEVTDAKLTFEGEVPEYVRGHFVQGGPGRYTMGNMRMTHAFDGFAKITNLHFAEDGVSFSSNFLKSSFLNASLRKNTIVSAVMAGGTIPPQVPGPKSVLAGHNDNNDVKCHRIGGEDMVLSDTIVASVMARNFSHLTEVVRPEMMALATPGVKWDDHLDVDGHVCATGIMAHGGIDRKTGKFIGAMGCVSILEDTPLHFDFHVVFEMDPAKPEKRKKLAKIQLPLGRRASYMHSMAQTENFVVLIAEPLHVSVFALIAGHPLSEGGLELGKDTIFQIVDKRTGKVKEIKHDPFLFSHIVNSWEEDGDVLMDVSTYPANDHMMFLGQFKFANMVKEVRDTWENNKIIRFRLRSDGTVQEEQLIPEEESQFELFEIDPQLHGVQKHCVFYAIQQRSNAYDEQWNSTEVGPLGAVGVAKRNLCTGERRGFYAPNEYPSEPKFVRNPEGKDEDDGVLVQIVFDGNQNTSYVQLLDAKTMERVARADLPVRVPFLVHSTYYPDGTPKEQLTLV